MAALYKGIKTPSRKDPQPCYKQAARASRPGWSFKEPARPKRCMVKQGISLSSTSFGNKYRSSLLGTSGLSQSDQSLQEVKEYKLTDFGLCVNVNEARPPQLGCNRYLAPEVFRLGPDHPEVAANSSSTSGSWTFTRWA